VQEEDLVKRRNGTVVYYQEHTNILTLTALPPYHDMSSILTLFFSFSRTGRGNSL
jgi:hypothetical protein